jgi:hypothetical protein
MRTGANASVNELREADRHSIPSRNHPGPYSQRRTPND